MDPRQVLRAVNRWRIVVGVLVLTMALTGVLYGLLAPKKYTSTTTLYFALDRSSSVNDLAQGSTFTQGIMKSYAQVATLPVVLDPVIDELGLTVSAEDLARAVSADTPPNTVLMTISVTDPSAQRSAKIANAVGRELPRAVASLAASSADRNAVSVKVTTIAEAEVPRRPSAPNAPLDAALGLFGGLLLAGLAVTVLEFFVSPLMTLRRAEETAPVLGTIANDPTIRTSPVPVHSSPEAPAAEGFRALRAAVSRTPSSLPRPMHGVWGRPSADGTEEPDAHHCLVVTSPMPQEGRSSVAINLAVALARSHSDVVLVDADLRRPAVAKTLMIDGRTGLVDLLREYELTLDGVIQEWRSPNWPDVTLHVLPAGGVSGGDAGELLVRPRMRGLIRTLRDKYSFVIIDSPPLLSVIDPGIIAAQTDGALMVTRAGRTKERDFDEAVRALELAGGKILGIVANAQPVRRGRRNVYRMARHTPYTAQAGFPA
jgi:polysaccharide biosynthesis transport protein